MNMATEPWSGEVVTSGHYIQLSGNYGPWPSSGVENSHSTSEQGKNYFDSHLISDMAMFTSIIHG
jgi:hypothetical protein